MKIGGIAMDWKHPDVEEIDINTMPALTEYDAVLIDTFGMFMQLVDEFIGDTVWNDLDGIPMTNPELAQRLRNAFNHFRDQTYTLCANGGLVVGFVRDFGLVAYSNASPTNRSLYRAIGQALPRDYVTSMELFYGPYSYSERRTFEFALSPVQGRALAMTHHSIWSTYLQSDVKFYYTFDKFPNPGEYRPIAVQKVRGNPTEKVVAAADYIGSGQIALLPHPETADAIILLLSGIRATLGSPVVPAWVLSVDVPGIAMHQDQIDRAKDDIQAAESAISSLLSWTQLLFEKDDQLDLVVGEALKTLGFTPTKPQTNNDADWIVDLPDQKLVIEVTGADGVIPKKKMTQLLGWINHHGGRGLLVANPFRLINASDRRQRHLDELISQEGLKVGAESNLTILFTTELFDLVMTSLEGRQSQAQCKFEHSINCRIERRSDNHWIRIHRE